MCESASLLAAASNLDVPPHPTPETLGPTPPLPSPFPAFIYYKDDFRYCNDDDSHLQGQEEEDGADKLLEDDDGADQLLGDDAPPPAAAEERAPTAGSLAAKLAGFARQKLAEVNASRAVVAGFGLVGGAVGVYFLLPAAAGVAAAGATMKAPGAAGFFISRAAFAANPQLYYQILRTAGAAAAFAL